MEDGIERKILEEMAIRHVVKKDEIFNFFKDQKDVTKDVINVIMRSLVQRGLIIGIYVSSSTFAITQKGIREVSD